MIESLPQSARAVIDAYLTLPLGSATVSVPYVTNTHDRKVAGLGVYLGKGSPEEIQEEAHLCAQRERISLDALSQESIREFLVAHRLGVDCSGFISHVLFPVIGKRLFAIPGLGFLARMRLRFRPFENVSIARLMRISEQVGLEEARPGDMIVTRGGHHALLIDKTSRDAADSRLREIRYVHSTGYFTPNGVRTGIIRVTNLSKDLAGQEWEEGGERNYTLEGYMADREKNGIYRIQR